MPEWSNFSSICKLRGSGSVQTSTGRSQRHNFADLQLLPSFDNFGLNMNSLWRHLCCHLFFRSAHALCADLETKKAFVATLKKTFLIFTSALEKNISNIYNSPGKTAVRFVAALEEKNIYNICNSPGKHL